MAEREIYPTLRDAMRSIDRNITGGDTCLVLYKGHTFREVEELDLQHVPHGTIVHFSGRANIAASYFLQIVDAKEGRKARMWKATHAPHLECSIDELVSFYEEKGKTVVERAMLKKGKRFIMPYFEYESSGDVKITKRPQTEWFDEYESIIVLEQKQ